MLVALDNTSIVAYINRQGRTHSVTLMDLMCYLFDVVLALGVTSKGSPHPRQAQQNSGSYVSVPPGCEHRVDTPPPSGNSAVDSLGSPNDRSDGNGTDDMTSGVC